MSVQDVKWSGLGAGLALNTSGNLYSVRLHNIHYFREHVVFVLGLAEAGLIIVLFSYSVLILPIPQLAKFGVPYCPITPLECF